MNKVPVIIREPDSTLGLANKIALPFTTKLCTTFPQTGENVSNEKKVYVGPVVRKKLREATYCGEEAIVNLSKINRYC